MNKLTNRRDARILRLEKAIARVELPTRCTAAMMRSALAVEEWEGYKASAKTYMGPILEGAEKRDFTRYKQCLRRGDGICARANKLSSVGLQALKRNMLMLDAEREYAAAWEILEQLLAKNPWIQALLDRPLVDCALERESMVRPLGSSSEFAVHDHRERELALMRCQRNTLLSSLARLRYGEEEVAQSHYSADKGSGAVWDTHFELTPADQGASILTIDYSNLLNDDTSLPLGLDDFTAV